MDRTEVDKRLRVLIAHMLGVDADLVTPEASLADSLGADSLDRVEITLTAEDAFGVQISDEAMEVARTYGDILNAVIEANPTAVGASA